MPPHILLTFDGESPDEVLANQGRRLYIFPTQAYINLYQSQDNPIVAQQVARLEQLIAEADGRTILFTGDGRSDHLLDGLEAAGQLDANGALHVDVLKVPHHGSDRNATRTFFREVTADTYVISANGHPDNPDLSTLIWIVESAQQQSRDIDIVATNHTPSLQKLLEEYPQAQFTYNLEIMPSNHSFRRLTLA